MFIIFWAAAAAETGLPKFKQFSSIFSPKLRSNINKHFWPVSILHFFLTLWLRYDLFFLSSMDSVTHNALATLYKTARIVISATFERLRECRQNFPSYLQTKLKNWENSKIEKMALTRLKCSQVLTRLGQTYACANRNFMSDAFQLQVSV